MTRKEWLKPEQILSGSPKRDKLYGMVCNKMAPKGHYSGTIAEMQPCWVGSMSLWRAGFDVSYSQAMPGVIHSGFYCL